MSTIKGHYLSFTIKINKKHDYMLHSQFHSNLIKIVSLESF